jgi:hypothetical protein
LTGQLALGGQSFTAKSILTVNFVACKVTQLNPSASNLIVNLGTYAYTIGNPLAIITFTFFQNSACGYPLTYTSSITAGTGTDSAWYSWSTTGAEVYPTLTISS